jgi:type VI secretion system Hcp family effector
MKHLRTLIGSRGTALCCGIVLSALLPATAHADYFMQLDGIPGESLDAKHANWINVNSFSWGISNSGSSSGGGGAGSGKPVFSDFSWTQALDSSITGLFSSVTSGKHIKTAVVDFTKSGANQSLVYFKMTFGDVLLSSVSLYGTGGTLPQLDGAFSFGNVKLDYWTITNTGALGAHTTASYDLVTQKGSLAALAGMYGQGLAGPMVASVPEPETYAMMLAGLGLIGAIARRRTRKAA